MSELELIAARARETGRLGIDTEFLPEGRYRPLLCLVQIAVDGEIHLLDPLEQDLGDTTPLAAVLADPEVEVVLHAGRQDVAILRRAWRTTFANVASIPPPERLAALMRCLNADCDELSEGEPGHGASTTETPNRVDRRGRR